MRNFVVFVVVIVCSIVSTEVSAQADSDVAGVTNIMDIVNGILTKLREVLLNQVPDITKEVQALLQYLIEQLFSNKN